eukprot:gnl/TRDRNA2_/TRDRNA2_167954_c3_seq1.p1 gnl/TRDRNA2_/TRDRNA2_167954_c3~~gnl/TRDRNA2_/TRDRNA2_167954_c3_seq1.p1  ORF type:complete len:513 (+),score=88.32 gnl/TRDRNA2_/TRDRNA2_167954_c3_seq1:27-1565(+)
MAMEEVASPQNAETQAKVDMKGVRGQVKESSDAVLQSGRTQQDIRAKVRKCLDESLESGELERVMGKLLGPQVPDPAKRASADRIEMRSKVRACLDEALESGELERVLGAVSDVRDAARVKANSAPTVEKKAAGLSSISEGVPAAVHAKVVREEPDDVDRVKGKAATLLDRAVTSGQLDRVLASLLCAQEDDGTPVADADKGTLDDADDSAWEVAGYTFGLLFTDTVEGKADGILAVEVPEPEMVCEQMPEPEATVSTQQPRGTSQKGRSRARASVRTSLQGQMDASIAVNSSLRSRAPLDIDASELSATPVKAPQPRASGSQAEPRPALQASPILQSEVKTAPPWADRATGRKPSLALPFSLVSPPSKAPAHLAPVFEAICKSDRKIGAMTSLIAKVQRQMFDRDNLAAQLEDDIFEARNQAEHLAIELEHTEKLLQDAEEHYWRLQERGNQLEQNVGEETMQKLKLRHTNYDPSPFSNRSELSTACTLRDVASPTPPLADRPASARNPRW